MEPAEVVHQLFEHMQARDWPGAAAAMSPEGVIRYTATGEVFSGASFMAMNEAYPDGWNIEIIDILASGSRVAAQVRVPNGDQVDWLSGFYTVADGVIVDGTEHWLTERSEPAPEWRARFAAQ